MMNPSSREFSFFSARHKSFSRIDYILASKTLFNDICSTEMTPVALSDHRAVLCSFSLRAGQSRAARWRFNTSLLQNDIFIRELEAELEEFIKINGPSVDDPRVLWDAVKGCIRNKTISFASNLNKSKKHRINCLESEIAALEQEMLSNFSSENICKRQKLIDELNSLLRREAEFTIHRTRQNHYYNSARPSRLLAYKLRKNNDLAKISAIRTKEGDITSDPVRINSTLQLFYKSLYTSEVPHDDKVCSEFLQPLQLPKLPPEAVCSLEAPIHLEELRLAIKAMNRGRSPGLDGIPPELFEAYWPQLGPLLLNMLNFSIKRGSFSASSNIAIISLLLKKGKPSQDCSSYRPLSLLNCEVKLYAKVLATRLEPYMSHLVHHDQTGFIKSRLASDNVRRLLHIIDSASNSEHQNAILSLDAEKAFDRLEWCYLWSVLEIMGFSDGFISMIKLLYANPSAVVITGSNCSARFPVTRSSRQGCPLSPLLFSLSLEPVAQAIRQSEALEPIIIHNTPHCISLYADDILIFTKNPSKSLPHLLKIFENFSSISGYKINWTKSALMLLGGLDDQIPPLNIPVVSSFTYLGVSISPSLNLLTTDNYNKVLKNVDGDLNRWGMLPTSFQSRLSVIKMNILPRINFVSSMIPLAPPGGYWKKLHSIISSYLWNRKKPRIKASTLQRHRLAGGINLPNFEWYSWSFVLRSLATWLNPEILVSWRPIEEHLTHPYCLSGLVYSNIPQSTVKCDFGPIISHLLTVWHKVHRFVKIPNTFFAQSPIFNNHSLLIDKKPILFPQWSDRGVCVFKDIIGEQGLRAFHDLERSYNLPSTFYFYLQLRTAMRAQGVPWAIELGNHPLHVFFDTKGKINGIVSDLYRFITKASYKPLSLVRLWKTDINTSQDLDWGVIWSNISLSSRNPDHQMIHYRSIHRSYLTPRRLQQMKLRDNPYCDYCPDNTIATLYHMVWQCPEVNRFWHSASSIMSIIIEVPIPFSPCLLLLNDTSSLKLTINNRRLLLAGLTAAKRMIVCRWKPPHALSVRKWLSSYRDIAQLELSTARLHHAKSFNIDCWSELLGKINTM